MQSPFIYIYIYLKIITLQLTFYNFFFLNKRPLESFINFRVYPYMWPSLSKVYQYSITLWILMREREREREKISMIFFSFCGWINFLRKHFIYIYYELVLYNIMIFR